MKVEIKNNAQLLIMYPESQADADDLAVLGRVLTRPQMISSRGFEYMAPHVQFLLQAMSRGD